MIHNFNKLRLLVIFYGACEHFSTSNGHCSARCTYNMWWYNHCATFDIELLQKMMLFQSKISWPISCSNFMSTVYNLQTGWWRKSPLVCFLLQGNDNSWKGTCGSPFQQTSQIYSTKCNTHCTKTFLEAVAAVKTSLPWWKLKCIAVFS